mgnify:CR=1 FL=1
MINIVYLVIFLTTGNGTTSQAIPQANMAQCQANARIFNTGKNNGITANSYSGGAKTQAAMCIVGVK